MDIIHTCTPCGGNTNAMISTNNSFDSRGINDRFHPGSTVSISPYTRVYHTIFLVRYSSIISFVILQMKSKHPNLLKHPLVTSLLKSKWDSFGRKVFFMNLFLYSLFLTFLTAFGLVALSPLEPTCK